MPSPPEGLASLDELSGAQLQRIDAPHRDLIALTLHRRELHGVLVVALAPRLAWGWVAARPRGEPASAFVRQLRKHLEGGRVTTVHAHPGGATLEVRRRGSDLRLHLVRDGANLVLEIGGEVVGAAKVGSRGASPGDPWPDTPSGDPILPCGWEELAALGPRLVEATMGAPLEGERRRVLKAVRRHVKKLRRRLEAIAADLERVDEVAGLRHRADLLLANLHAIANGAAEAIVTDWDTGSALSIPIRAGRSAREEAEALYGRAGKLERGGRKALERRTLTEDAIADLEVLAAALGSADQAALAALERRAQRLGVATRRAPTDRRAASVRLPYRKFYGSLERPILVGKSASDNDALTQSARPWDHWLHARGVRGSHVVIPLDKRETCPAELLLDAAHLAAHYSAVRGEPLVDVQHCARRYVRKAKGMAAGAVLVEQERVVSLRVEDDRLAALLETMER